MGSHLVNGKFKSDKYPWCPEGFVPLKTSDKDAQPVLAAYSASHRARDPEFSDDLDEALKLEGHKAPEVKEINLTIGDVEGVQAFFQELGRLDVSKGDQVRVAFVILRK